MCAVPMADQTKNKHILLVKDSVLLAHDSHYAGGVHLFSSLAKSVSLSWSVHVFTTAKKALVMHHALQCGLLGSLSVGSVQSTQPAEMVTWQCDDGIRFHVMIEPETAYGSSSSKRCCPKRALIEAVAATALQLKHQCRILLDVDTLQHALVLDPTTAVESTSASASEQQPFMYALVQQLKQQPTHLHPPHQHQHQQQEHQSNSSPTAVPRLAVLVQNLHHLPFGPCGTAPRTQHVLYAWQHVSRVLCVSNFVANYMTQHALPLLPRLQSDSNSSNNRLFVVHPAALGAFAKGPFPDLGPLAADRIWGEACSSASDSVQHHQQLQQQQQEEVQQAAGTQEGAQNKQKQLQGQHQPWQQLPVIGMLKLTREKGSELYFKLARRLAPFSFLAVCADEQTQQEAASAGLPNLTLVPPVADISEVLQQISVLLVPSVLHEAFGMVVVDAQLRGVPVIVADAGALLEASAGAAAAVLPVSLVEFPTCTEPPAVASAAAAGSKSVCGTSYGPSHSTQQQTDQLQPMDSSDTQLISSWQQQRRRWQDRVCPEQDERHADSWAAAVQQLLSSREVYLHRSRQARAAAERLVQPAAAGSALEQLLSWLSDS